jgi:hypothetical protein
MRAVKEKIALRSLKEEETSGDAPLYSVHQAARRSSRERSTGPLRCLGLSSAWKVSGCGQQQPSDWPGGRLLFLPWGSEICRKGGSLQLHPLSCSHHGPTIPQKMYHEQCLMTLACLCPQMLCRRTGFSIDLDIPDRFFWHFGISCILAWPHHTRKCQSLPEFKRFSC